MRARVLVIVAALFAASLVRAEPAQAKSTLAILGIEAVDADETTQVRTLAAARVLTEGLRARVAAARAKYELAPNSDRELGELKLLSDCLDEGRECMSQIGLDLGADRLMFGRIERRRDGYAITIRLLNVGTRTFEKQKTDVLAVRAANDDGMRRAATVFFSELTGVNLGATLVVTTNVPSGTIYVDGQPRGVIANRTVTVRGLAEGALAISIESPGYKRWDGSADTSSGEVKRVEVTLQPETEVSVEAVAPPPPKGEPRRASRKTYRALAWTSAVVTAGGVTAFTITGLKVHDQWGLSIGDSYEDRKTAAIRRYQASYTQDHPGASVATIPYQSGDACSELPATATGLEGDIRSACDGGKKMQLVTNVLVGASATMALVTGFFVYKGYLEKGPASERELAKARRHPRPAVRWAATPQIYPQGAGLGAVIQF